MTCVSVISSRVRSSKPAPASQRGVALVVALLLLLVITLVGLAAVHGTLMQQKMSANLYDRQVAFQNAEAAMRVAQQLIASNPGDIARNCQAGGVVCPANPFNDPNLPSNKIISVNAASGNGAFAAGNVATGQPQYVIENMGLWQDPNSSTGSGQSAGSHNYGAQGLSTTVNYYRVTARSGNPKDVGGRAVVTLQAMVKQG
ncbi:PilX N-terminal domain-containing pilus assembly protein [Dyella sp. ASV21]|uniref:pilus assembly PilX family protein n=1 Tax=Dyella sp. ASV21 TaxID=2795114 RepID=UPI0018ECDC4F|nr:PilX N-terminal domain-containing pilus assembly protein [Dyella sp. ASV21]